MINNYLTFTVTRTYLPYSFNPEPVGLTAFAPLPIGRAAFAPSLFFHCKLLPLHLSVSVSQFHLRFSKLLYFSHAVSESCTIKEYGGGMCPLARLDQSQISPTNGRFDPLHISSQKYPFPLYRGGR